MTGLAFWTGLAITILIVLPAVIVAFFLRDAATLLQEMNGSREDVGSE